MWFLVCAAAAGATYEFPDEPDIEGVPYAWVVSWPDVAAEVAPPGRDLEVVVAFTNPGPSSLRIPADPFAGAFVFADHTPWNEGPRGFGHGLGFGHVRADQLVWVTVAPGETVTHRAAFSRWAPACAAGCPAGRWDVGIQDPRPLDDASADQVKPALDASTSFRVAWPSAPAPTTAWTATLARRRGQPVVVVRNVGDAPLWVPTRARSTCSWRRADGSGATSAQSTTGGDAMFDEADTVRIAPRKSVRLPAQCDLPADAVEATVRLDVVGELWATQIHADAPTLSWVAGPIEASRARR